MAPTVSSVSCVSSRRPAPIHFQISTVIDNEPLHYKSLFEVGRMLAAREISPVELTRYMLERIEAVDPTLKSYATVTPEAAIRNAAVAEREIQTGRYRGLLHGVPVAVKDLCCTNGVRTMGGLHVLRDFVPNFDATVVTRLQEAGAVHLGKLNLTEGAMAAYHPDFEIPVNPWGAERWAGVSSSGSGVAVAAGLCFGAIGTDTGGSIRLPSSANGVVGLKPTYGRVSRFGVLPLAESLDHVGPMARRVVDVAILFDAIAGFDPMDQTGRRERVPAAIEALRDGVEGLRIGIDREYAGTGVDPGQAASIEDACMLLSELGAEVVEVRVPDFSRVVAAWHVICSAEAAEAHREFFPARASEYGPFFREFLEAGSAVNESRLRDAHRVRDEVAARFSEVLGEIDALACPAGGAPSFVMSREVQYASMTEYRAARTAIQQAANPPQKNLALFTMPMNFARVPAICLPSGFSAEGVPYSLQLVGRHFSEGVLCRIAHAYEEATDWHARRPDLVSG